MMKYFNIFLVVLNVFLGGNTALGQENKFFAVYDFHVHNPEQLQEGQIRVEVIKGGINTRFGKNLDFIEMNITDSITRVVVPISEKVNYVRLGAFFGRSEGSESFINMHVGNNLFIAEDKDTIEVHLYPKQVSPIVFKGMGADKYTVQYETSQQIKIDDSIHYQYRDSIDKSQFKAAFGILQDWIDFSVEQISKRLDNINLSSEVKKMLLYDYIALLYDSKRILMQSTIESSPYNTGLQQMVLNEISIPRYPIKDFEVSVAAKSRGWVDMVLYKEWLTFALERHPDRVEIVKDNDYGFANYLAERHTGVIRDKLFYLALVRDRDRLGLRTIASPLLRSSLYAEAFRSLSKRLEGSEIYEVEMQDGDAGIHRFEDYRGKVLVIDMWYTGCIPCLYLAKELKIIQDEMMDRDDVIFISLSFDKYRDTWLETLKTGEYTHERGVNLWIGEKAMRHPIVEHYSLRGVPQLMIVDKNGVLVAMNPTRPVSTDPQRKVDFKKLIESYR